jgi:hypothetical protein
MLVQEDISTYFAQDEFDEIEELIVEDILVNQVLIVVLNDCVFNPFWNVWFDISVADVTGVRVFFDLFFCLSLNIFNCLFRL